MGLQSNNCKKRKIKNRRLFEACITCKTSLRTQSSFLAIYLFDLKWWIKEKWECTKDKTGLQLPLAEHYSVMFFSCGYGSNSRTSVTKHLKNNVASGRHVSRRCQRSSLYQVDQIPFHDFKSKIKRKPSVQSPKSNKFIEEYNDSNDRLSEEGCDD